MSNRRHALPMLFAWFVAVLAAGLALAAESSRRIEAAFLRNFAHYVIWPAGTPADDRTPWRICVIGDEPFSEILKETVDGRIEQGRAFEVAHVNSPLDLPQCHIAFVAYKADKDRRAVLASVGKQPVLTVSEAPGFLQEGGIIEFRVADHIEMSINLDQARAASLTIQTGMLEVASEVLENGTIQQVD